MLSENWKEFDKLYPEVLEYIQTNAQYAEEGRIYNLDGLYYWIKKELELSEQSFYDSQFYLGLTKNKNNAVLARINLVGLLIARNKLDEATLECEVASELLLDIHGILFQQIANSKNYQKHREYIGLLALIDYCRQLKKFEICSFLLKNTSIEAVKSHAESLSQGTYPKEVFENTCIVHAGIITLTR